MPAAAAPAAVVAPEPRAPPTLPRVPPMPPLTASSVALGFGDKIGQALSDALDEGGWLNNMGVAISGFFTETAAAPAPTMPILEPPVA